MPAWWDPVLSLFVPLYGFIRGCVLWPKTPVGAMMVLVPATINFIACFLAYHWGIAPV